MLARDLERRSLLWQSKGAAVRWTSVLSDDETFNVQDLADDL